MPYSAANGWSYDKPWTPYRKEAVTLTLRQSGAFDLFQGCNTNATTDCRDYNPAYCTNPSILCSPGLTAAVFPASGATVDGFSYYESIIGTGGGIRYYNRTSAAPVAVLTDRTDYLRVQAFGGKLYFLTQSGGPLGVSAMYRLDSLPTALQSTGRPAAPLFADAANNDWFDFDIGSDSLVVVASSSGLYVWRYSGVTGAWSSTLDSSVGALQSVAISPDLASIIVTTGTDIYVYGLDAGSYRNNGLPVLSAPGGFYYRGLAFLPVLPTPTATASITASATPSVTGSLTASLTLTSSPSASISQGAAASATPTTTGSPSQTGTNTPSGTPSRTGTATPTGTITPRSGPLPTSGFVLVTVGGPGYALPNTGKDITIPVSIGVYGDVQCGATNCDAPVLNRAINPWSSTANNGTDRWGNRFFTINSGNVGCVPSGPAGWSFGTTVAGSYCGATYRMARVVPADNRGSLTIAGFDVYAGFDLATAKREPSMFEMSYSGYWNVTTPCEYPGGAIQCSATHGCKIRLVNARPPTPVAVNYTSNVLQAWCPKRPTLPRWISTTVSITI